MVKGIVGNREVRGDLVRVFIGIEGLGIGVDCVIVVIVRVSVEDIVVVMVLELVRFILLFWVFFIFFWSLVVGGGFVGRK